MDTLGLIVWYAMFITPLLAFPLAWRLKEIKTIYRILIGLLMAVILSFIFYHISLAIIFRDGMGP